MRERRSGQAIILLLLALGIFLLGAVGLAVESSLYFTHRQMAQAAADAAAQAAMSSIFARTNTGANLMDGTPFVCDSSGTDLHTPCHFARQHGFGRPGSNDAISVDFPQNIPGVGNLSSDTPNMVGVTIARTVTAGLLQFIGVQATTIRARGVAAIVIELSPVPILVMHPDAPDALDINGNPSITICGGPTRSIQVNSVNAGSYGVRGKANTIDLSGAGPDSTTPFSCDGSGGEFGNHGGPFDFSAPSNGYPGGTLLPTDAYQKTLPIDDPLAIPIPVSAEPTNPGAPAVAPYTIPGEGVGGASGCQRPSGRTCTVYSPGEYAGGMVIKGDMALLNPGLYYMNGGGFKILSNGVVHMAPCTVANQDLVFGCGIMIYNDPQSSGDIFEFAANAGKIQGTYYSQDLTALGLTISCSGNCFQGSPEVAPYYGVIFMNRRSTSFAQVHVLGGGAGITVAGTIYLTNSFQPGKGDLAGSSAFQRLQFQGGPGSSTQIVGRILVDSLGMGGNPDITMTLNPNSALPVRKLALVR